MANKYKEYKKISSFQYMPTVQQNKVEYAQPFATIIQIDLYQLAPPIKTCKILSEKKLSFPLTIEFTDKPLKLSIHNKMRENNIHQNK